ncbi:MAG: bifunctional oligoribonuclease/PAP phosphatase NrnA [Planctomycetes bacterium]|nr:bifunctional oligoribonuclease/PAP phosphatase NrnA [Planctomycetota bacterium]
MNQYTTNTSITQIASRINAAKRILLTTHSKPDGDALGSVLALSRALNNPNRQADIWLMGPLEPNLKQTAAETPLMFIEQKMPDDDYDLVIVSDTGAWSQLDPLEKWLRNHYQKIIVIDHHARGDDVGELKLIDSKAASTTQIIAELLDELDCPITGGDGSIAEALFIGLATDTGWFRFSSAQAEAFYLGAKLLEIGVDKTKLFQLLEETLRPQRLALEARALSSLEFLKDGSITLMMVGIKDFKETNCTGEDLANLVNAPMVVGSVRVSILLTQAQPKLTKISFRSKPLIKGSNDPPAINVNDLAQQFGGGGHINAAGARMECDIDEARKTVIAALQ